MKSLRNTKNGRIFTWTPELANLPHMILCDDVVIAPEPLEPLEHSAPTDPVEAEQKKSKPPKKPKAVDGGDQ